MKYWIVDAFSSRPFGGNPALVMLFEKFPSDELLQNIAMEIGFSNTAFVVPLESNKYFIRWFTPQSEAPLCGHATVAAIRVLYENGLIKQGVEIALETVNREVAAIIGADEYITLKFPKYEAEAVALQMQQNIINLLNTRPVEIVFAENCIMAIMQSEEEVAAIEVNLTQLMHLPCRALIVTSDSKKYDFVSRYFAPSVGINEDPVCASAHTRLIPLWAKRLGKDSLIAAQLSKRGGILQCTNEEKNVLIAGQSVVVAEGVWKSNIKELQDVA